MEYRPKTTLEQWRIIQAVVDYGGYAQAAQALNKSQSSLNHAVAKMQQQLGVQLLEVRGRKAYLTSAGEVMLRRSRQLTQQVNELEALAGNLECGWEPEITVSVESIFPKHHLYAILAGSLPDTRGTRINIVDNIITGTMDAIEQKTADIVIAGLPPKGYLAEHLRNVEMLPVCHPAHILANTPKIEQQELAQHLQIVIRDTSRNPKEMGGWLKAEQRWTVDNMHEAKSILQTTGEGFCWMPKHMIDNEVQQGTLKIIDLVGTSKRVISLNLVIPSLDNLGPCAKMLANQILKYHDVEKRFD